jgi:hypothetical protein
MQDASEAHDGTSGTVRITTGEDIMIDHLPEGCEIAKRYTSHGFLGRYGTIVDVRSGLVNLTLTSEIFTSEGQLCSMLPEQAERLAAQLLLCAKKLRRAKVKM